MLKARLTPALTATLGLFATGYVAGRVQRPAPPPLIIERRSDSPLNDPRTQSSTLRAATDGAINPPAIVTSSPATADEIVYLCGARTKKGTPCSRRVHGPVRCWQHMGMPTMLPQEKLLVKQ